MTYDPVTDFEAISLATTVPGILVSHPSLPVRSLQELIALARARSGELSYASTGNGGPHHLGAEMFSSPEMLERLSGEGADVIASTPEEFSAYMKREVAKWARVIKESGIRLD